MDAILEICCGLDVHRDNIVACLAKGALDSKPTSESLYKYSRSSIFTIITGSLELIFQKS